MNFPNKICFKEKTPKGGKLTGWIVGDDIPTSIKVKGTNDVTSVKVEREKRGSDCNDVNDRDERDREREHCRGHYQRRWGHYHHVHSGIGNGHDEDDDDHYNNKYGYWESRNKYQTLKQTLVMIKNGAAVAEANYDERGNLIVEPPIAVISNNSIEITDGEVEFAWTAVKEVKITQYNSEHKLPNGTDWTIFHIDRPLGNGSSYSSSDTPTEPGTHEYRLTVVYNDDNDDVADAVLMNKSITITPPPPVNDATVEYLTLTANDDGGESVHLEWKTTVEINVKEFRYERQKPGEAAYLQIDNPIQVQAPGAIYSTDDVIFGATGSIFYRLIAIYFDDTTKVIASQSINL